MQYLSKDKHSRIASEKKRCESEEREEIERRLVPAQLYH